MPEIPSGVLTEEFQRVVRGRRVRCAAFFTFRFDPGFFEREILPAFFDIPMSNVPEIRLLNLAEALRSVDSIAVYYDRHALEAGSASSRLDVQRVPILHSTGYFHPKTVLAIVEEKSEGESNVTMTRKTLIAAAMSANLTRAGWWENVEVAHIIEVPERSQCSFREDLIDLIVRVRSLSAGFEHHQALDAIQRFVEGLDRDPQRMRGDLVLPRLYSAGALVDFLVKDVKIASRLNGWNLEILSPYFDNTESLGPIEALRKAFHPSEIRVCLPRALDGTGLCSEDYYQRIAALTACSWGRLPKDVMKLSRESERALHAKVYRFFNREKGMEAFFIGSANLTNAAFSRGGNIESGFYIEQACRKPDWWLSVDRNRPAAFMQKNEDDGIAEGDGWRLSIIYCWNDHVARAFWDDANSSPSLALMSNGVELGLLNPLPPREWVDCSSGIAASIRDVLTSHSFIRVRIEGQPDATILVSEEEMTHKPSLMASLTASDILRYWSLLTPEQKKEFLEEHAEAFDDPELTLWLGTAHAQDVSESFFATFAQVYLSFGNLGRTVRAALEEGREREAVDRLFGRKFDSLRRLVEQLQNEQDADPVRRYIAILCSRQLLDGIRRDWPEFSHACCRDEEDLMILVDRIASVRDQFQFGTEEERTSFFRWFDRWFLTTVAVPELAR